MKLAYRYHENSYKEEYSDLEWISQATQERNQDSAVSQKIKNARALPLPAKDNKPNVVHTMPELNRELEENFKTLSENVAQANAEDGTQVFTITSATSGEGSSTIAYFLALKLAQQKSNQSRTQNGQEKKNGVLLIDANPRRPVQHQFFGIHQQAGLANISLVDSKTSYADRENDLYLLTSRTSAAQWRRLIESGRFQSLINKLRSKFEYILIDAPSVLGNPETAALSKLTDGVLLIIKNNPLRREVIVAARHQLSINNVKILGAVFNNQHDSIPQKI